MRYVPDIVTSLNCLDIGRYRHLPKLTLRLKRFKLVVAFPCSGLSW